MAKDEDGLTSDQKLERGVLRSLFNWIVILAALAVIGAWVYLRGWYQLEPGESAVVLRLGAMNRIVPDAGLHFLVPSPLEYVKSISVRETRHVGFGRSGEHGDGATAIAMQTADSNIVNLSYELQYTIDDPYSFLYGVAQPREMLVGATQSAVRWRVERF